MITTYRSPGGGGVRLDGGTTYTGAEISAHFDSMLSKLTCRGRTFEDAVAKARRAVAEFRIRGVTTNIAFLQAVLDDPDFRAGRVTTSFIETHPQLLQARASGDRGTKLMTYLADVTVNQPHGEAPVTLDPVTKLPDRSTSTSPPPTAPASCCSSSAPRPSRAGCASRHDVAVTDTTFRDAHQSLLATRVRSTDLLAVAAVRRPQHAAALVARVLGRRDVRRGAALPLRGPVGAAGRAAPGGARTSACRCCCAAATRSATRRTPPR